MTVDLVLLDLHFSWMNIILSLILTTIIFFVVKLHVSYRNFKPYKKDKVANHSFLFFHVCYRDFKKNQYAFQGEEYSEFRIVFEQMHLLLDVEFMKNKSYRSLFQKTLRKHHRDLEYMLELFSELNNSTSISKVDVTYIAKYSSSTLKSIKKDVENHIQLVKNNAA